MDVHAHGWMNHKGVKTDIAKRFLNLGEDL